MDRKSIMSIITEYGIDQEILDHIFIYDEYIKTDLLPGGIPYMECCGGNLWSGAYSYDDMRGPQGRFTDVPFEEAFGNILESVEMMINDPKSDYYYHPDKVMKR